MKKKSTFAKYLNEKTNIQVYSLDLIRWANMKNGKKDKEYKDRLVIIHNYDELSDEMMIL